MHGRVCSSERWACPGRGSGRSGPWALLLVFVVLVLTGPAGAGADRAAAKGTLAEVAGGARAIWVAHPGKGLLRLDYGRDGVTSRLDVGRVPIAVAALHGEVWSVDAGGVLARVDEVENRVERRVQLGFDPTDVAVSERAVWVVGRRRAHPADAILVRIDPRTAGVVGAFHLGARGVPRLAVGHDAVWLAFGPRSRGGLAGIVGIEERTGRRRLRRLLHLGHGSTGFAVGRAGVWVLAQHHPPRSELTLLDPDDGSRVQVTEGPSTAGDMTAGFDLAWVAALCSGLRCDVSRPLVQAYDRAGRLVAGPFVLRCGPDRRALFLSGITQHGPSALLLAGDGRGGLSMMIVLPKRGVVRCIPL